jgi:hypothetical protein
MDNKKYIEEFIANNAANIDNSEYFPYIIILTEEKSPLYFSNCMELQWYKFDSETGKYAECKRPRELKDYLFNSAEAISKYGKKARIL